MSRDHRSVGGHAQQLQRGAGGVRAAAGGDVDRFHPLAADPEAPVRRPWPAPGSGPREQSADPVTSLVTGLPLDLEFRTLV
jgi:hypothetical protein